jgi:DNA polymerase-3 subunit delta'
MMIVTSNELLPGRQAGHIAGATLRKSSKIGESLGFASGYGKIIRLMNTMQPYQIDVIGHEWAINLLHQQAQNGRMPQSLLITGPYNVGKGTLARYLAQYLNCQAQQRPCGACNSCRKVVTGNHPDVRILDDDTQALKIEQVRDLQHELSLSPVEGRYRVAVLCNFERATTSAANALLKTLEEPASSVVIILTAPDPGSLLPTVVSRCQMVTLRPVPVEQVSGALQQRWQALPQQADLLAQLSAGRLGWAVRGMTDEAFLERRNRWLDDLKELLQMHRAERLVYANALSRDSIALKEALTFWLTIWRDLLLLASGSETRIVNLDYREVLQTLADQCSAGEATQAVKRLQFALLNLDKNVNARLNLEVLLLKLPRYTNIL